MLTLRPSHPKAEEEEIFAESIIPHYLDGFEEIFGHS
jgi:hypothetical protein